MQLEKVLEKIGLSDPEAKVYLALLELGESTVTPLSQLAGIERTYCYDILAKLAHQHLAISHERNGRLHFAAQPPKELESHLSTKLHELRQALPELQARYNADHQKPTIRFYDGVEKVRGLYRELANTGELSTIAGTTQLHDFLGETLEEMAQALVKNKAKVRELLTPELGLPKFAKIYQKPLQEIRYLPAKTQITTDTLIYSDKVVFIAYSPDIHAVVIDGSAIVSTQKILFDQLWKTAKML
ncbi:MAG TPA: helix-turn-helix domain-containing protein [Candidatus Saccharimonadales bacterium]|nr:helix-turn-helix domain-containing protein [Candidatus Saccharimonadales bacterium]